MNQHELAPDFDIQPCRSVKDQIHAYLNGTLSIIDEMDMMQHIEGCAECREYFDEKAVVYLGFQPCRERESNPTTDNLKAPPGRGSGAKRLSRMKGVSQDST